jgi:hypothetical protein
LVLNAKAKDLRVVAQAHDASCAGRTGTVQLPPAPPAADAVARATKRRECRLAIIRKSERCTVRAGRGTRSAAISASAAGNVAALLMGSDGGFITGSDFLMDGGVTASYWYGELAPK